MKNYLKVPGRVVASAIKRSRYLMKTFSYLIEQAVMRSKSSATNIQWIWQSDNHEKVGIKN